MQHNQSFKHLMCLAIFLNSINPTTAMAIPSKIVLGTRAGASIHQWDGRTHYTLILATFKSKREADNYRRQMAHCVKYSRVYVSYMNKNDRYAVVVAPIHNLTRLHQICEQAKCRIHAKPSSHIAAHHNIFNAVWLPTTAHKPRPVRQTTKQVRHTTIVYKHPHQVHDNLFAWIPGPQMGYTKPIRIEHTRTMTRSHTHATHPRSYTTWQRPLVQSHAKSTKKYPVTRDKDGLDNVYFTSYHKPFPYIGMTTGPVINASGAPSTYAGWQGTAFGGFGLYFNPLYYIGVEVFGSDSAQIRNLYPTDKPDNARSSWIYGINLLPGIMVNPMTLVYFRGGVANAFFLGSNDGAPGHTLGGWQIGVGAQASLTKHFDLRGEYVFTDYSPDSRRNSIYYLARDHIYSNQVNVGIVYKIDV